MQDKKTSSGRFRTEDTLTGETVATVYRRAPRHEPGYVQVWQKPLLDLMTKANCPSKNELRVLLAVIASMGYDNQWSAPLGQLAALLGWERSAVSVALGKLVERQLLQVRHVSGRESQYRVGAKLVYKGNVIQRRAALKWEQLPLWEDDAPECEPEQTPEQAA